MRRAWFAPPRSSLGSWSAGRPGSACHASGGRRPASEPKPAFSTTTASAIVGSSSALRRSSATLASRRAATPAGSTGYNLANQGPILAWGVEGFVVSFIAPHTLTARPLVVAPDDVLHVTNAAGREPVVLVVDGEHVTVAGAEGTEDLGILEQIDHEADLRLQFARGDLAPCASEHERALAEAGMRNDQVRLVDEAAGDRQAALHATGQGLDPARGFLGQLHELQQLVDARRGLLTGNVEVAGIHLEVLPDRQLDETG